MEKESLKRYLIFLAALILCAGAAWYFSKDTEDPQDNAVLAGSKNLIIDLGTMSVGKKETEEETEKRKKNEIIQEGIIQENEAEQSETAEDNRGTKETIIEEQAGQNGTEEDIRTKETIMQRQDEQKETIESIRTKANNGEKKENTEITEGRNNG